MDDYPERNPFPKQSTATVEENIDLSRLREWARRTPTALLPGVKQIGSLADDYMDQFAPVGQPGKVGIAPHDAADTAAQSGTVACLYGAHGTGKTHAARYMMASVASPESRPKAPKTEPVLLYLQFTEPDFVREYQNLVPQLRKSALIDLTLRYLGMLASEEADQQYPPEWRDEVRDEIGDDPARVLALFSAHLVDAGEVLEAQAREIAHVARGGDYFQFQRALTSLLSPEQADDAYAWLCGREISAASAQRLGISRRLSDPETCKYGLQLLATLVTRAGQPFVLVLDQCEKFILKDGTPITENLGLLHGLVEVLPRARAMLALLCSTAGWSAMPPDLQQRIGDNAIHLLALSPEEELLVLSEYLNVSRPGGGEGITPPFTEDGARELLRRSGGNLRRLLQLSWACFEAAFPDDLIDEPLVAKATATSRRSLERSAIALAVEREVLAAGLTAERIDELSRPLSFCIPDARNPWAVIGISEAVFIDDEAENALEVVTLRRELHDRRKAIRTILIITGYASPAVLAKLRESLHDVLVADDTDTFARQLKDLIGQLSTAYTAEAQATSLAEQQEMGTRLAEVARELEELRSARRSDAAALGQSIAEALAPQLAVRQTATSGWKARRRELEQNISTARSERQAADWAEFIHYRREALRLHRFRWLAIAIPTGLAAIAIGVAFAVSFISLPANTAVAVWSAVLGPFLAVSIVSAYEALLSPRARRLSTPINSARDLENMPGRWGGRTPGYRLARDSADPAFRYAAAMQADPDGDFEVIADRIMNEQTAIVRQALGSRLALSSTSYVTATDVVLQGLKQNVSEVVYLLDRPLRRTSNPGYLSWLSKLPERLSILVAVVNSSELNPNEIRYHAPGDHNRGAELVWSALGADGSRDPIARAFRKGPAEYISKLGKIPEAALIQAASIVSPFERDGLGTFDRLSVIREVDALYLFFEQLRFLLDEESSGG